RPLFGTPDEGAGGGAATADALGAADRDDGDAVALDANRPGDERGDRDAARRGRADELAGENAGARLGGLPELGVGLAAELPLQLPRHLEGVEETVELDGQAARRP